MGGKEVFFGLWKKINDKNTHKQHTRSKKILWGKDSGVPVSVVGVDALTGIPPSQV